MSDPDLRPLSEIEDELTTLGAHLSAGMSRWLELLWEFDVRAGYPAGFGSFARWLAWRCGLDLRTAREHVRVARALHALPLVKAAFGRGELSYAKVRALTRVEAPVNEDELLELAGELTATQLERALGACRRVRGDEADEVQRRAELSCTWEADGSLLIRGRLAPEDGALFLKALDVARERLWQDRRDAEPEAEAEPEGCSAEPPPQPRGPTQAEALVAVADASLAREGERNGGDRYQVVVHVDHAALHGEGLGACVLEDGPPLAADTARRLACDSSLVSLVDGKGAPLALGRKTRTISPALRRALRARDRCCRFPGCTNTRGLQAHHIEHWARGGETNLDNLLQLCRLHHRFVHEGGYTVASDGSFSDPHGSPLPYVPRLPRGAVDELRAMHDELELGPETCKGGTGERLDFRAVVGVLNQAIKRHRGFPRPVLVWRATHQGINSECRPVGMPHGTARIDTVDEEGNVLASEVVLENAEPYYACELALDRCLDYDFDDGGSYVVHHMSPLREPGPCPQPLRRPEPGFPRRHAGHDARGLAAA